MMKDRTDWAETVADQLSRIAVAPLSLCVIVRSSYSSEKYYVQSNKILYIYHFPSSDIYAAVSALVHI